MKTKQPKIEKGTVFTGWATFNWGICHQRVYRTKREAMAHCIEKSSKENNTWDSVKDYFRVVKVKCITQ